jgi:serine/threonine-protein kinase
VDLDAGDVVGPYVIERPLGEGGMGLVFLALDADGDEVALKLVRSELAGDSVFRRRFEREASAARSIADPRVVAVLDVGEFRGVPYMAQQYVAGRSLRERLEREGPLDLDATVVLCLQVAKGLDAVHARRLVHRDLKPSNILLDDAGAAYITDFGLAKDRDASALTKSGHAVGSYDYMAPEQIRALDVTPAADVYSLGCVVYECLSGDPPFADRDGVDVLRSHLHDEPPDLCDRRAGIPDDVGWAVARALQKEPARRPPNPTAYAHLLQVAAT